MKLNTVITSISFEKTLGVYPLKSDPELFFLIFSINLMIKYTYGFIPADICT